MAEKVTINRARRLYVIPCGDGFTCLGFDVAERRRVAVLEWMGRDAPPVRKGTMKHYNAYHDTMMLGRAHAGRTKTRCPAELEPRLIGLEKKRVEVTCADGEKTRFWVGKSTGWMPCHLEILRRDSSGGGAVYLPDDATVRVIR